jgi:hypothetical protein
LRADRQVELIEELQIANANNAIIVQIGITSIADASKVTDKNKQISHGYSSITIEIAQTAVHRRYGNEHLNGALRRVE